MSKFVQFTVLFLFGAQLAAAADAPPSEASIRELLTVMEASKVIDTAVRQVDSMVQTSVRQVTRGQPLSAEQQGVLDATRNKMLTLLRDDLKWESIEPSFVETYRTTFTQDEITGMIQFYRSPVGQAAIHKMPAAIQQSMGHVQTRVQALMPQIQQMQMQALEQMRAAQPAPEKQGE